MKRILLFMMAMALSVCASAQVMVEDENDNEYIPGQIVLRDYVFSVGAKAGGNYSLTSSPYSSDFGLGGAVGYSLGVAANVKFSRPFGKSLGAERFGVQLEGLFSGRSISTNETTIDMKAIEFPLLFQWYYLPGFCVEAGPTFTSVLSTSPDRVKDPDGKNIQSGQIKGNDVMLTLGLGYKDKSGFTASIRYNKGNSDLANNFKVQVSTLSVSLGWLFTAVK